MKANTSCEGEQGVNKNPGCFLPFAGSFEIYMETYECLNVSNQTLPNVAIELEMKCRLCMIILDKEIYCLEILLNTRPLWLPYYVDDLRYAKQETSPVSRF